MENSISQASSGNYLDADIRLEAEQVRLLYGQARPAIIATSVIAIIVATVMWDITPQAHLLAWVGAVYLLNTMRIINSMQFKKENPDYTSMRLWKTRYLVTTFMSGSLWGFAGFFFMPEDSYLYQMFFSILIAGMSAGAISTHSSVKMACYLFIVPATLPIAAVFMLVGTAPHIATGFLILIFIGMLLSISNYYHNTITKSLSLHFENTDLIDRLKKNITQLKKSDEEIEHSEERFKTLSNASFEIIVISKNGIIIDVNDAFGKTARCKTKEAIGMAVIDFIAPEHHKTVLHNLKMGYDKPYEVTGVRKDGTSLPIEVQGRDITINGEKARVTAIRDLTERKKTEENLSRLAKAVDQATDSIVITDSDGTIYYTNSAFSKTTGFDADEVIGKNHSVLVKSGEHDTTFYKAMWEAITSGKVWEGILTNRKKSGELYKERANISPVFGKNGSITGFVAVKRNVTSELEADSRRIEAQKMEALGTLAGGIAHDFNNILFAMLGYASLAAEDLADDSSARENIEEVIIAGGRATLLVRQILAFTRQSDMELKPVKLSNIAKETIKLIKISTPPDIKISLEIETEKDLVIADATQMQQVVMNLCSNAVHSMGESGTLDIVVSHIEPQGHSKSLEQKAYVTIAVSDTWHGMTDKVMRKIFDPFFTTKDVDEGTGMGLSMTQGIIASHDGKISVDSTVNEGSKFNVYLPYSNALTVSKNEGEEHILGGNEKILVVDDEEMIVGLMTKVLTKLGYEVYSTTSVEDALDTFKNSPDSFSLVLTDQSMPKMTGTQFASEIMSIKPDVPVILVTGYSKNLVSDDGLLDSGVVETLNKPISPKDMARAVRKVLDIQRGD